MTATAKRLEEQLAKEQEPEADLCPICYTNELKVGEISNVTLECDHSFCRECSIAQLRNLIENGQIERVKCFDYECLRQISVERLGQILAESDKSELLAKFERFKAKKDLQSDPLVRYCPKPGCGEHMRGENQDTVKLQCSKCETEICFKCREKWHGAEVSCTDAIDKDLQVWVDQNKENVSFCPMCRTRIEKNKGCNHMTCAFCKYEFCWACGQSKVSGDGHFDAFGSGCSVAMMDENVKPGDYLLIKQDKCSKRKRIGLKALKVLAFIIFCPIILVFYLPCKMTKDTFEKNRGDHWCLLFTKCLLAFIVGLVLDICFIPLAIMHTALQIGLGLVVFLIYFIQFLYWILTCRWLIWIIRQCKGEVAGPSAATKRNQEQARANIERLRQEGKKPGSE